MVSQNWKNSSKASPGFPRPIRDPKSGGAPTRNGRNGGNALAGFVVLSAMHTLLLWALLSVVKSAGIVSWGVSVVDTAKLATLYVMWRSLALMSWDSARGR